MIATLGEAHDAGWRLKARCAFGRRDGMKSIRECIHSQDLDLPTMLWTRGRNFPIAMLASRLKCPQCGSRKVAVYIEPPPNSGRRAIVA
jgi:hypothetical protein